ncbi:MAG: hypothetical protein ACYC2R_16395, partial [Burkholderiales bacterium]
GRRGGANDGMDSGAAIRLEIMRQAFYGLHPTSTKTLHMTLEKSISSRKTKTGESSLPSKTTRLRIRFHEESQRGL